MKTLALLSLSLAVALGMPPVAQDMAQNPGLTEENQSPVKGDWVPVQGHVVVEEPAPQIKPSSEEQQEKLAAVPVDMKPSVVELESKVKPQVQEKQEVEVKTEDKPEPEVKVKPEVKVEPEVKVKPEVKMEPEVKVEPEVKAEPEVEVQPEVMAEFKVDMKPEVEMEPELKDDPDFMVESEVKVEPDVLEVFQRRMNLEAETEASQDIEERHIDMEGEYEMVAAPIMDLEPMDDDDDTELSEVEKSLRAAFQNQVPVNQPLPEEEEGLIRERTYVLNEEPIMELEPLDDNNVPVEKLSNSVLLGAKGNPEVVGEPIMELVPLEDDDSELSEVEKSMRASFQNQNPIYQSLPEEEGLIKEKMYVLDEEPIKGLDPEEPLLYQQIIPNAAFMDEGPALDSLGQPMLPLEEYYPNEEARVWMGQDEQQNSRMMEGPDYVMMEEPGKESIREEEPAMEGGPVH